MGGRSTGCNRNCMKISEIVTMLTALFGGGTLTYLLTWRRRQRAETATQAGSEVKTVGDMVDQFTHQLAELSGTISQLTTDKVALEQQFGQLKAKLAQTEAAYRAAEQARQQLEINLLAAQKTIEKLQAQLAH